MQEEIWKDIAGWEGYYQISNLGKVKSLERKQRFVSIAGKECFYKKREMMKKTVVNLGNGYRMVSFSRDSKAFTKYIHRLVAEAFIPNPDNLPWINHKDGDKLNNSIDNLEWCTPAHNIAHAISTGLQTQARGERASKSKLDSLQVLVIKSILASKEATMVDIAKYFNVTHQSICAIKDGKSWVHIKYDKAA